MSILSRMARAERAFEPSDAPESAARCRARGCGINGEQNDKSGAMPRAFVPPGDGLAPGPDGSFVISGSPGSAVAGAPGTAAGGTSSLKRWWDMTLGLAQRER